MISPEIYRSLRYSVCWSRPPHRPVNEFAGRTPLVPFGRQLGNAHLQHKPRGTDDLGNTQLSLGTKA
jgi:hypothetical protein